MLADGDEAVCCFDKWWMTAVGQFMYMLVTETTIECAVQPWRL